MTDRAWDVILFDALGLLVVGGTMIAVVLFDYTHRRGYTLRRSVGRLYTGPVGEFVLDKMYYAVRHMPLLGDQWDRYKIRTMLDELWGMLPDRCESPTCKGEGRRGDERILKAGRLTLARSMVLCNKCANELYELNIQHDPRTEKDEPDQ